MLDTQKHPRILSAVLVHADRAALLALRGVSHSLRSRADSLIVRHLSVIADDVFSHRVCELITTPSGRVPAFMPAVVPRDPSDDDDQPPQCWVDIVYPEPAAITPLRQQRERNLASLRHVRILDFVDRRSSAPYGALGLPYAPLLECMCLDVVRFFPDENGRLACLQDVHARTAVYFVVRAPANVRRLRLMEIGPPSAYGIGRIQRPHGCAKAVVHLLYNDGIVGEGPNWAHWSALYVPHTVFVLNPYRRWLPAFHAVPFFGPPNPIYTRSVSRKKEGRPRQWGTKAEDKHIAHLRFQEDCARLIQSALEGSVDGGRFDLGYVAENTEMTRRCTLVNLARTPPHNLGFPRRSNPDAVEQTLRDRVQAHWRRQDWTSMAASRPTGTTRQELAADAVAHLEFLSAQEYADTLTPEQALDEGFVAHVPGQEVRRRFFLPPPRKYPRPSPPQTALSPDKPYLQSIGPHPGTLDLASFPHIGDTILALADREALLALRGVCRHLHDRVDERFARHLIIPYRARRESRSHPLISSPFGTVPALTYLVGVYRDEQNHKHPNDPIAPAIVARMKRLLAGTVILDFHPNYGEPWEYFDDVLSVALTNVACVRTFRTHNEPQVPFPTRTLVYYHTPGRDETCDDFHRPRDLVPDGVTKVVHHIFPAMPSMSEYDHVAPHLPGFDKLRTRVRGVQAVVVVFTPYRAGLCPEYEHVNPQWPAHPADREVEDWGLFGEERRDFLVTELAKALDLTHAEGEVVGRSVTLVNAQCIPPAWLGLPDDWDVGDTLAAEVRGRVPYLDGHSLRLVSGEEYAAELSPEELEMEGTIQAVPGIRHRLLPQLQMMEDPPDSDGQVVDWLRPQRGGSGDDIGLESIATLYFDADDASSCDSDTYGFGILD